VPKVQHKPIKRSKLGFKRKEQNKSKRTLVWRTGLSGVPPDSVRCTRVNQLKLFTFGFLQEHSAIIHRTVRCATGLSGVPSRLSSVPTGVTAISATVDCAVPRQRYSSRQKLEQVPEAHRTVNNACPVRHRTVWCTKLSELQRSKPSEP
jgi:hypothetical protein